MALFAFDGTWNERKDGSHLDQNTNVVRFFDAYRKTSTTHDTYVEGIGTRYRLLGKLVGGAFGLGARSRVDDAYDHLCRQWDQGDRIIDIVGFSRGAATSLDFCNEVQRRGITRPGSDDVVEARPQIRFLGLWDTVAAFGLGITGVPELNFGHRLHLPKERLQYAFHALALDERRLSFLPTRLKGACEVWFRGVHSDVGGSKTRGLGDIALAWMMRKARSAGLPITPADIAALRPVFGPPDLDDVFGADIRHISAVDRQHHSVSPVEGCRDMPDTCVVETIGDEMAAAEVGANGIDTLPEAFRLRFETLQAVAEWEGVRLEFPFDPIRDAVMGLIETRMPLVVNDAAVELAVQSIRQLLAQTMREAKAHQYKALNEYFVNKALFDLNYPFPFAD